MATMRLFVGTFLSPHNQAIYRTLVGNLLRRHRDMLRAVPDGSVHLTYAFIANLDELLLDSLVSLVAEVAHRHCAFDVELLAPRVLRAGARPRLVCADLGDGADRIDGLASALAAALAPLAPDLRPSRTPHVTLARFRKHATRGDGVAVDASLTEGQRGRDQIARVQVVTSVLTTQGPVYAVKAEASLASAQSRA